MPSASTHEISGVAPPFSHYGTVAERGDHVFIAGQVGLDADGGLVGTDVGSQTTRVFEAIARVLSSRGLGIDDVVRFVSYLTDRADIPAFYAARENYFARVGVTNPPPNTLLIVAGLAGPELRVEIDATAIRARADA